MDGERESVLGRKDRYVSTWNECRTCRGNSEEQAIQSVFARKNETLGHLCRRLVVDIPTRGCARGPWH